MRHAHGGAQLCNHTAAISLQPSLVSGRCKSQSHGSAKRFAVHRPHTPNCVLARRPRALHTCPRRRPERRPKRNRYETVMLRACTSHSTSPQPSPADPIVFHLHSISPRVHTHSAPSKTRSALSWRPYPPTTHPRRTHDAPTTHPRRTRGARSSRNLRSLQACTTLSPLSPRAHSSSGPAWPRSARSSRPCCSSGGGELHCPPACVGASGWARVGGRERVGVSGWGCGWARAGGRERVEGERVGASGWG